MSKTPSKQIAAITIITIAIVVVIIIEMAVKEKGLVMMGIGV